MPKGGHSENALLLISGSTEEVQPQADFGTLARHVSQIAGVMSCSIIDPTGQVLGQELGELPHTDQILQRVGPVGATMWGGLRMIEPEAGKLVRVIVTYKTYQIVGIPLRSQHAALLITASLFADLKDLLSKVDGLID